MQQIQKDYSNSSYEDYNSMKLIESNHLSSRNLRKANKINLLRNCNEPSHAQLNQPEVKVSITAILNLIPTLSEANTIEYNLNELFSLLSTEHLPDMDAQKFLHILEYLQMQHPLNLRLKTLEILHTVTNHCYNEYHCYINTSLTFSLIEALKVEENETAIELVLCIIGNITKDGNEYKNSMISQDIAYILMKLSKREFKKNCTHPLLYAISGLCNKPEGIFAFYAPFLEIINESLLSTDQQRLELSSRSLINISEQFNIYSSLKPIISFTQCIKLLVNCHNMIILQNMLLFLGNVILGDDDPELSCLLIENGIVGIIEGMMGYGSTAVKKECCWILTNICSILPSSIGRIMKSGIWSVIVSLTRDESMELKNEAFYILTIVLEKGNGFQKELIIKDENILQNVIEAIELNDSMLSTVCIRIVKYIILHSPSYISVSIISRGYLDVFQNLIYSKNNVISKIAEQIVDLIDKYK
jgi:hypothetical protein